MIAEDDDTYEFVKKASCEAPVGPDIQPVPKTVERILMCGWRRDLRDTLNLYENLTAAGTEIHIMCTLEVEEREEILKDAGDCTLP